MDQANQAIITNIVSACTIAAEDRRLLHILQTTVVGVIWTPQECASYIKSGAILTTKITPITQYIDVSVYSYDEEQDDYDEFWYERDSSLTMPLQKSAIISGKLSRKRRRAVYMNQCRQNRRIPHHGVHKTASRISFITASRKRTLEKSNNAFKEQIANTCFTNVSVGLPITNNI